MLLPFVSSPIPSTLGRFLRERVVWLIAISLIAITSLHYLTDAQLIPYHSIYRSLYYIPIAIAAVRYGWKGGLLTAGTTAVFYFPHVLLSWDTIPGDGVHNVLETILFLCVGTFAGYLSDAERIQRQRAEASSAQLAIANIRLRDQAKLAERTRAQVASILESIDSGVITINTAYQMTAVNKAATSMLSAFPATGEPLPELLASIVATGVHGYQQIQIGRQTLGIHGAPLRGAHSEVLGTVLVLDDLTELRGLEEQVQRAQRLAALGRLAGGLAHEIRNPLGIVRAAAQMVHTQLQEQPHHREYTAIIQTEIDRVDRLIEQLLEYARPQPVMWQAIDLHTLASQAAGLIRAFAGQHTVVMHSVISPDLPKLEGDAERLHQALVNLLMNAVQATPPNGEVHLEVTGASRTTPPIVQIIVRDTGCGIPPGDLQRIFDPFFSTRDDGVGLGLSIVQQIIEEHHGTIEVSSELGMGTAFVIRLQ